MVSALTPRAPTLSEIGPPHVPETIPGLNSCAACSRSMCWNVPNVAARYESWPRPNRRGRFARSWTVSASPRARLPSRLPDRDDPWCVTEPFQGRNSPDSAPIASPPLPNGPRLHHISIRDRPLISSMLSAGCDDVRFHPARAVSGTSGRTPPILGVIPARGLQSRRPGENSARPGKVCRYAVKFGSGKPRLHFSDHPSVARLSESVSPGKAKIRQNVHVIPAWCNLAATSNKTCCA